MTCVKCHPAQATAMLRSLLLLALACGVRGQNVSSTTNNGSPQAIVDLNDDDFQLFVAVREPEVLLGSTTSSSSSVTRTTPRTTVISRTPTRPPGRNSFTVTTTSVTRTPMIEGNSWVKEDTKTAGSNDVPDQQFKPTSKNFAERLQLDQDLPSETTTKSPLSTFDAELYVLGLGKAISLMSTTYSNHTTISPLSTFDAELYVLGLGKAISLQSTTDFNLPAETTTDESSVRTTTTTPGRPQRPISTSSTSSVPKIPVVGGSLWLEEDTTTAPNSDVLGQQFRPAGQDFTTWLMQQMKKIQEVTSVPQHTTVCSNPVQEHGVLSSTARPTTVSPFPAFSSGQPGGHQQSLHSQLQTSQQLPNRLLTLWTPSGSFIQTDAPRYTPTAVSYQTSAVTYGKDGVSHNNHYQIHHHQDLQQQKQQLPFLDLSHSTDTYLSHQKPGTQLITSAGRASIAVDRVPPSGAVFYSDGSYYYTQPVAPPPPQVRPYPLQYWGGHF